MTAFQSTRFSTNTFPQSEFYCSVICMKVSTQCWVYFSPLYAILLRCHIILSLYDLNQFVHSCDQFCKFLTLEFFNLICRLVFGLYFLKLLKSICLWKIVCFLLRISNLHKLCARSSYNLRPFKFFFFKKPWWSCSRCRSENFSSSVYIYIVSYIFFIWWSN